MGGMIYGNDDHSAVLASLRQQSLTRNAAIDKAIFPIIARMPRVTFQGYLRITVAWPALIAGARP